jgi:hypothetical protein
MLKTAVVNSRAGYLNRGIVCRWPMVGKYYVNLVNSKGDEFDDIVYKVATLALCQIYTVKKPKNGNGNHKSNIPQCKHCVPTLKDV